MGHERDTGRQFAVKVISINPGKQSKMVSDIIYGNTWYKIIFYYCCHYKTFLQTFICYEPKTPLKKLAISPSELNNVEFQYFEKCNYDLDTRDILEN